MMDRFEIDGEEVLDGEVKPFGNSAHVTVPKRWIGADVKVVRTSKTEEQKEEHFQPKPEWTENNDDICSSCGRERQDLDDDENLLPEVTIELSEVQDWICSTCRENGRGMG